MPSARRATKVPHPKPAKPVAGAFESQVSQAYARIEEQIVTLQLGPGQIVSESTLAERIALGRTPVRGALQQLAREGLVVILPQRGIIISEIDVRKQLRLLEVRRYVEQCIVQLATKRATAEERARFAQIAQEMDHAGDANDGKAFLSLDAEFNQLLLTAARNEYATASMKLMQGLSRRFWYAHYRSTADVPQTARLHAAIARAVAGGDEAQAVEALRRLLDNVETFTRATLDAPL